MFEIRTYVLASQSGLEQYANVHWKRHILSLAAFGVRTHHVWTEVDGAVPRLVALVEYEQGLDPEAVTERYMASPEFRADMAGFPMGEIRDVSFVRLEAASSDPATSLP
ncbi:NIPSNAP family protein [Sinomonas susongensis]|uniref:NIPSNAP family protein n=1 Tax=Sinomonas susongensis TaxID=1324851 RepID=UPI001109109E|nr:NIPSNAP family protein [Sinomonas susongensis]